MSNEDVLDINLTDQHLIKYESIDPSRFILLYDISLGPHMDFNGNIISGLFLK